MIYVFCLILFLYALPLVAVALVAFMGLGLSYHGFVVTVSEAVQFYKSNLALLFGNILTPLAAAFALKSPTLTTPVPRSTKVILPILAFLLILAAAVQAQLASHATALGEYGRSVHDVLIDLAKTDARELVTLLALVAGISLKERVQK